MSMWGLSWVGGAARVGPMSMWGLSWVRVRAMKGGPFRATRGSKRPLFCQKRPLSRNSGPPGDFWGHQENFAGSHG